MSDFCAICFMRWGTLQSPLLLLPAPKEMWRRGHWRTEMGFVSSWTWNPSEIPHVLMEQGKRDYIHRTAGELGCQEMKRWCCRAMRSGGLHLHPGFATRFFNPKIPLTFPWRQGTSCRFTFAVSLCNWNLILSGLSAVLQQKIYCRNNSLYTK